VSSADGDAHERLLALTHDLRTPLTLVTGYAAMLARDNLTDDQRTEYLRRLSECAREMTEILDGQDL
jgi:signal transduction histidine kinase